MNETTMPTVLTTTGEAQYRPEALPVPTRLRFRPVERGYPVPWFVAKAGDHYDFRVMDGRRLAEAVRERRCWICGQSLGRHLVFTVGPMCAINRVSAEPPSHRECAEYAARVCPFLIQREQRRRTEGLPEGYRQGAGIMIERQPGVVLLWVTRDYRLEPDNGGVLFRMGEPVETVWLREGRPATRSEIEASIESGYPLLFEMAKQEGPIAIAALERQRAAVVPLLPPAAPATREPSEVAG
jgi:hypothetical protein